MLFCECVDYRTLWAECQGEYANRDKNRHGYQTQEKLEGHLQLKWQGLIGKTDSC